MTASWLPFRVKGMTSPDATLRGLKAWAVTSDYLLKAAGLTASTAVAAPAPPIRGSEASLVEDAENES
jgi:hypothetical protein